MTPLEVLVREAVQNSWDARHDKALEGQISITVCHRELDRDQLAFLRSQVLVDTPDDTGLNAKLAQHLVEGLEVIEFADRGTVGLSGPMRADTAVGPGAKRNYADFVLNIGRSDDKADGAGTYGYGKASFYLASSIGTVVVDSVCELAPGVPQRRLLACALARAFESDGQRFTGRHWWVCSEAEDAEGVVALVDEDADLAAESLGLPARSRSDFGTTVMVVAPNLADFSASSLSPAQFIAEAVAWNFWPKMLITDRRMVPGIKFEVFDGDQPVVIPNPEGPNRIRPFAEAKKLLDANTPLVGGATGQSLTPIRHGLGNKKLGDLALIIAPMPLAAVQIPDEEAEEVPEPLGAKETRGGTHHVVLMRNEELVVTYRPQMQPVKEGVGLAGVFRCAEDVEQAFAMSEPPTHDGWKPDFVPPRCDDEAEGKRFKSWVNVALEKIRNECKSKVDIGHASTGDEFDSAGPLGEAAHTLAAALAYQFSGPGGTKGPPNESESGGGKGGGGGKGAAGKIKLVGQRLVLDDSDRPAINARFFVQGIGASDSLGAATRVILDPGGTRIEREPPEGTDGLADVEWHSPDGRILTGETVNPSDAVDGEWTVRVTLDSEAKAALEVTVK